MTEEERPDDDADQITLDTFKEVSNLFEQTSTLLAHASNKLTYQRRFNILSTLIDNNTIVSDLLRTHADILNHKDNNFLFGEKFEEIMVKDCKSKKKSKEMFSGLKRPASSSASGSSSQIPFRQGSLPNRGQRGGGRGRKFFSKLGQKSKFTTSLPKSKNSRAFITTGLPQGSSSSEGYISSQGNSLFASSRQIKVFSKELGVSDSGSSNPGLCSRLSNTFSISSKTTVSPSIKVQSGEDRYRYRYRNFGDAPKRGYNRSTIKRQSDFKSNFYCTKEGLRIPSGDKLKKPEFTHTICSFQNGGTLSPEGLASGERYNVQTRSERCLLFGSSQRELPELSSVSVGQKGVPIPLSMFWRRTCSEGFHKIDENTYCNSQTFECIIFYSHNILGRHSDNSSLRERINSSQGHTNFSFTELGIFNKHKEIRTETYSKNSISRGRNRFQNNASKFTTGKSRQNKISVSIDSKEQILREKN